MPDGVHGPLLFFLKNKFIYIYLAGAVLHICGRHNNNVCQKMSFIKFVRNRVLWPVRYLCFDEYW